MSYNYQSSKWYEKTYSIFDKKYEENKKKRVKKNKRGIVKKIKSLFD